MGAIRHRARLYVVNSTPIKLRRQAAIFAQISEDNGESAFVDFLAGNEAAPSGLAVGETSAEILAQLRDKLRGEQHLVVAFGSELRAGGIAELVRALPQAKFICLGDYANSRGAADMGLYPDLLPGYVPAANAAAPNQPGLNLREMFEGANDGRIKALYIVGSNPVARYGVDAFVLSKSPAQTERPASATGPRRRMHRGTRRRSAGTRKLRTRRQVRSPRR